MRKYFFFASLVILLFGVFVFAGPITNSSAPTETGYTLTDIYNLIHNQSAEEGDHSISAPSHPTATTSFSVSQIYAELANLIQRENLETGTTYLGITGDYDNPDTNRPTTEIISSSLTPDPEADQGSTYGYSLEDIWNLISNSTTTAGAHAENPTEPPADSMHSLTAIYEALVALGQSKAPYVNPAITYLGVTGTYDPLAPISYWSFDGDATDSVGNNDGAVTGATLATGIGGVADTAYSFDGVDDYIDSQALVPIEGNAPRTYSFWTYLNPGDIRTQTLLGTLGGGATENFVIMFNNINTDNVYIFMNGSDIYTGSNTLTRSRWHHVVVTYNGGILEEDQKIYVDGVSIPTILTGTPGASMQTVSDYLHVGKDFGSSGYSLNGKIDDIKIYDRALSAEDVTALYDSYTVVQPEFTSSYWAFDGDATDTEGSNDGTIHGATLTTGVGGVADTAYRFDGVNDYISTGITQNLQTFSLSLWVKPNNLASCYAGKDSVSTRGWMIYTSDGTGYLEVNGGEGYGLSFGDITPGIWSHILVTSDGSQNTSYVNGVQLDQSIHELYNNEGAQFSIGRRDYPDAEGYMDGSIDEVHFYNRVLTGVEAQALYDEKVDITPPAITDFTIPATASALVVDITTFTATDNIIVSDYLLTESDITPAIDDPLWSTDIPTTYTFASSGVKILYAWVRDSFGNISASANATVEITLE